MVGTVFDDRGAGAARARALPQRGPSDPDERRHVRQRRCAGCRRWSSRPTRSTKACRRSPTRSRPRPERRRERACLDSTPRGCAPGATCNRSCPRSSAASTTTCAPSGRCRSAGSTCWRRCANSTVGRVRRTSPRRCGSRPRASAAGSTGSRRRGGCARHRDVDPDDHRAVEVELTRRGRALWREMNVSYRRSLQARFADRCSTTTTSRRWQRRCDAVEQHGAEPVVD